MPGETLTTAVDGDALAKAHQRLVTSGDIQTSLPVYHPPATPWWLQKLLELLSQSGPVIKILFWAGLAVIVVLLLWGLYGWLAPIVRQWLGRKAPAAEDHWTPEAAPSRALLAEADALAAGGAFAEAVHLLLLRSVEQIEARFPGRLRPSWTSRDITRLSILPPAAARAFGTIADVVETGIFAQRPVSADAWAHCRQVYETMALGAAR